MANRQEILEEILIIEDKINTILRDQTYLKIKRNLNNLEKGMYGSPIAKVDSPDDLTKVLTMRRHSSEMKEVISKYKDKRSEYEDKITALQTRKEKLQKQLFLG